MTMVTPAATAMMAAGALLGGRGGGGAESGRRRGEARWRGDEAMRAERGRDFMPGDTGRPTA